MRHKLDKSSGSTLGIDYAHHEIHDGKHFAATCEDASLGVGETLSLLIQTPDSDVEQHTVFTADSSDKATLRVYRGVTVSDVGAASKSSNRNHRSSNVAVTTVTCNPTVTDFGTIGRVKFLSSVQKVAGEYRSDSEIIFAKDTNYLIEITSEANANRVTIEFDWYEHTDRSK